MLLVSRFTDRKRVQAGIEENNHAKVDRQFEWMSRLFGVDVGSGGAIGGRFMVHRHTKASVKYKATYATVAQA